MAKLYQHRTDGTYYTKRYLGAGSVTWHIHPDGVAFLKQQDIIIGAEIPSFAMRILNDRSWLFTREEASQWREIDWAPAWETLGRVPVGHYPLWLARQRRDCAALLAASRRQAEGEQLAHHKEEAAWSAANAVPAPPERAPRVAPLPPSASAAIALVHPEEHAPKAPVIALDGLSWLAVVLAALLVIAIVAVAG